MVIKSFPKWELCLASVQWEDDLANAAAVEAASFHKTTAKTLCLEQESTECKHEVVGDVRTNHWFRC